MERQTQTADGRVESVLHRALDLPVRDQLRLNQLLGDHLRDGVGRETAEERAVRVMVEAIAALRRAADHLGLPEGQAPTGPEYERAAREIDLGMSKAQVQRAWDRWDDAVRVYEGETPVLTAAQLALRRRLFGLGSALTVEPPVVGVERWLGTEPASTRRSDYEAFAREYNDRIPADEPRLLQGTDRIREQLRLDWPEVLAVARGEIGLEEAQEQRLRRLLDLSGPVVGMTLVGSLLGTSNDVVKRGLPRDFPLPVAVLNGHRVWARVDVEAYRDGREVPARFENELQGRLVDAAEVRHRVQLGVSRFQYAIRLQKWDLLPQPAGKVGRTFYWMRTDVEAWFERRQD